MRNPFQRRQPAPEAPDPQGPGFASASMSLGVVTEHASTDEHARIFMAGWDACLAQIRSDDPDGADSMFEQRLRQERYDVICRLADAVLQSGEHPPQGLHRWLVGEAHAELAAGTRPTRLDLQPFRDVLTEVKRRRGVFGGGVQDAYANCASLLETALAQYEQVSS